MRGEVFEVLNPKDPFDQWKRVPVAGAFVFVQWKGFAPQPFHGRSVCLHLSVTRTDAHGRFSVPSWWAPPKPYPVIDNEPRVWAGKGRLVHKSDGHTGPHSVEVLLVKDQRPPGERLFLIEGDFHTSCDRHARKIRDLDGSLAAFYRELHEEARQLNLKTMSDKQRRNALLVDLKREISRLSGSPLEEEGREIPQQPAILPLTSPEEVPAPSRAWHKPGASQGKFRNDDRKCAGEHVNEETYGHCMASRGWRRLDGTGIGYPIPRSSY